MIVSDADIGLLHQAFDKCYYVEWNDLIAGLEEIDIATIPHYFSVDSVAYSMLTAELFYSTVEYMVVLNYKHIIAWKGAFGWMRIPDQDQYVAHNRPSDEQWDNYNMLLDILTSKYIDTDNA